MPYIDEEEKKMLEDVYNRVMDVESGNDAATAIAMIRKAASRLAMYRYKQASERDKYMAEVPASAPVSPITDDDIPL
jgi:hypothetical protein